MARIPGFATPDGTASYKSRFAGTVHENHFRQQQGLWFSSIGAGSYLGEPDQETDFQYEEGLKEALNLGVNVVDSAINYRAQRSERSFGKAIGDLIHLGKIKREEIILCTKGGFIPFDGEYPRDPGAYFRATYVEPGILKPEDVAQGCHAMTPAYLENQLQKSLTNLNVETIDIYYLHNPETQLAEVEHGGEFKDRILAAFEWMEKKVKEGKIRMYGTATWNGYRVAPGKEDEYLSLENLVLLAREVAGADHHFKAVQLPLNLAMPEAWVFANQKFGPSMAPFLPVAQRHQMTVIASASLLQARLTMRFPEFLDKYFTNLPKSAQRAIQFTRSVPGITTALVGMKQIKHVAENLETAKVPPLDEKDLLLMFQQK